MCNINIVSYTIIAYIYDNLLHTSVLTSLCFTGHVTPNMDDNEMSTCQMFYFNKTGNKQAPCYPDLFAVSFLEYNLQLL